MVSNKFRRCAETAGPWSLLRGCAALARASRRRRRGVHQRYYRSFSKPQIVNNGNRAFTHPYQPTWLPFDPQSCAAGVACWPTAGILDGSSNRNWGLMRASCHRTPKNRWAPVERPVEPTRPRMSPLLTSCLALTLTFVRWKYVLINPFPCFCATTSDYQTHFKAARSMIPPVRWRRFGHLID